MKNLLWFACLTLVSCAGFGNGMLVQFDPLKPLDAAQLSRHCEMEDAAACLLEGKSFNSEPGALAIIQGMAPTGRAVFSVLLAADQPSPKWFLFDRKAMKLAQLPVAKTYRKDGSHFRLEQVEAAALEPALDYEILLVDASGRYLDHRSFHTFRSSPEKFRFALISCTDDNLVQEQRSQWADVFSQSPDAIFAIGDNVYSDYRNGTYLGKNIDPQTLWNRYAETRNSLAVFRQPRLTPILATWDDHDFGMNDGNETYPHIEKARETMQAFFPVLADAKMILDGPGVSRALKVGGQAFLLFDDRSFRSENEAPSVCRKNPNHELCRTKAWSAKPESTHFGRIQEDWAFSLMKKHNGPIWLISGDQWFGDYHPFESFEGNHSANFSAFLKKLEDTIRETAKTGNHPALLFASGDRHLTEIMKVKPLPGLKYETYEFTSSGMHAKMFPGAWKEFPNPRQVAGESGVMNYSLFDTSLQLDGVLHVKVQSRGLAGRVLYEKTFHLKPAIPPAPAKKTRRKS